MRIKRTSLFKKQFIDIVLNIAKDKKDAAKNFKDELNGLINNLVHFPYKYKKSNYYSNDEIREMTFKGYSIIYRVNNSKNTIEILEVFNRNLPVLNYKI